MDIILLLCIVSMVITGFSEGSGVLPDGPFYASVGGTVTLGETLPPPDEPFILVSWNLKDKNIITSHAGGIFPDPDYEDRITFFPYNGSLQLRGLTLNDSGEYTVTLTPSTGQQTVGTTRLDVYEPVSNVTLTSNVTDVCEFSSVRLSCSSSGSSLSFLWMNSSSEVSHSDRVQITEGNTTLTIVSVTRYDQGPFRCRVSNPVSEGISDPIHFSISYGPENVKVVLSPFKEYFEKGSDILLSCSAVSQPPAQFMWFENETESPHTDPELRLTNVQEGQTNYSCQAFNTKTLRNQTSQPAVITVLEKISGVSVRSPSSNLTVEGTLNNLTCEASGSIHTRNWMKNGVNLVLSDNMMLHDNSRLLSFNPVSGKDSGEYFCNVSNPISHDGAKYTMVVNYGPENVQITGPDEITVNKPLKLTCSADSTPSATYTWIVNGKETNIEAAEFVKDGAEYSDSGNYTCRAYNNITDRSTSSAVHPLAVGSDPSPPSPCPPGCVAGIVIGVCAIIGLIAGISYFFYKKKNQSFNGGGETNNAFSAQELNYADVRFVKHANSGSTLDPQDDQSHYAQVKVNNNPAAAPLPSYDAHMQRVKRPAPQPGANGAQTYAQVHKNPSQ